MRYDEFEYRCPALGTVAVVAKWDALSRHPLKYEMVNHSFNEESVVILMPPAREIPRVLFRS